MATIATYFEQAQLSLAAYALNLQRGAFGSQNLEYVARLVDAGMSQKQAEVFAATYSVVDQFSDSLTGFSATVFDKAGVKYFAIRGTQFSDPRDLISDAMLAVNGVAATQSVALYNYYQRLVTPRGQPVAQLEFAGTAVGYRLSNSSGATGILDTPLTGPIGVTGHSLGGHLAMVFGRLFPVSAAAILTYNAPGFNDAGVDFFFGRIDSALGRAGSSFQDARTTNLYGNGLSIIAGFADDHGMPQEIFLEGTAHSIIRLTDSLALYEVMARIDSNASASVLSNVLKAASNRPTESLEAALDSLRKLFKDPNLPGITTTAINSRDQLYRNLYDTGFQQRIASYAGQLQLSLLTGASATDLANIAQGSEALAYRYALRELNPFAVLGNNAIYDQHNQDGSLNLTTSGTSGITPEYLTDRAEMLSFLIQRNVSDLKRVNAGEVAMTDYIDRRLVTGQVSGQTVPVLQEEKVQVGGGEVRTGARLVAFGSPWSDTFTGAGLNDRLYGGGGRDILNGQGGVDYIQGDSGDDVIDGGAGNDILVGGKGFDTYLWNTGDGTDTIKDEDRKGQVIVNGTLVRTGFAQGSNVWATADGEVTLTQNSPLTIHTEDGSSIVLESFQDGDFGIHLKDAIADPVTTREILGDLEPLDADPVEPGVQTQFDDLGNLVVTATPAPDRADTLNGSVGNDNIVSGGGDDIIAAKEGDDWIKAGTGRDRVSGGAGKDLIEGGLGADIISGNDGTDRLYGNGQLTISAAIAAGNADAGTGLKGDWLNGGAGDDIVIAGADNDVLFGGAGEDLLIGGAGDDVIDGDDGFTATSFDWTVTEYGNPFDRTFSPIVIENPFATGGGADEIHGGNGNDQLSGISGNDVIYGDAGNDTIAGDDGDDTLFGGTGDDRMTGDYGSLAYDSGAGQVIQGNDYLDGGDGNDWLQGEGGDDILFGGAGNDEIWGDAKTYFSADLNGEDYIDGEDGNDNLIGQGGADVIFGGAGDDFLFGDADDTPIANQGADYLDGEDGNDYLRGYGGNDELFGGDGNDQLLAEAGDDYLDGEAGDDILDAGDGNDTLFGGAGADQLSGGAGDDTLDGGAGADTLAGGAGNDTYIVDMADTVNDTEGNNRIIFATNVNPDALQIIPVSYNGVSGLGLSAGAAASGDPVPAGLFLTGTPQTQNFQFQFDDGTVLSQAELYGSRYFGSQFLTAGDNGEVLNGGAGNDTLIGGAGGDTLYGWDGNDNLDGGAGQDTLVGGRGNDEVRGGNGSDTYVFARGGGQDTVLDAGDLQSIDVLQLTDVLQSDVALERMANGDLQIRVNGTDDRITVQGHYSSPDNRIEQIVFADGTGLGAADLQALQVAPITGTPQDDALAGTPYDDTLLGLAGNDVLDGGAGNDRLEGGAGEDTYVFDYGMGSDTLYDADGRIVLQTGLGFDDLRATRQDNDLLLAIRGTAQGALLKDYSLAPQNWVIENSAGAQTNPEAILQATAQAAQNAVQSAWDDHASAYRAELIARYQADGYRMGADGVLRRSPAFNDTVSAGVVQGAATTTWVVSLFSGGSSTTTFTTPINDFTLGASVLLQGTATIQTVTTAADDPEIFSQFSALTESFTDENVLASITWNPASLTGTETWSANTSSGFLYGPPDPGSITGGNSVIGFRTDTIVTRVFGGVVNGTVTAVLPLGAALPQSGFYPEVINARITYRQSVETIEEIRGGPGNSTISFDGANSLLVDAGAGDDVVRWSGLSSASGRGNFLYGNAGADELSGGPANDVLVGGTENDTLDGGSGADTYLIISEDGGFDLIDDTANTVIRAPEIGNFSKYSEWYYRGLGIEDFHSRMAGFGPPLPPLPQIAANNYTALAPLYAAGLIETDTVEFAAGIGLADLQLSWGQYQKPMPAGIPLTPGGSFGIPSAPDPADFLFTTLDISWAPDGGARLVIPRSESPADFSTFVSGATLYTGGALGVGVEQFRFADGTVLSMEQMLLRAPPAPSFDPQLVGEFLFQPGMGVQTADTAIESVRFAAGIQPEDVTVTRADADLLLTYNNGADALRVPDWYSDPASIPSLSAIFDSGTTWDAATLTAQGLVMHGTADTDTLTGLSLYSNVLIGGPGNDTLAGGTGDDTYVFDLGDGVDHITDPGGNNALQFGSGITPDALSLGIGSLLVRVGTGGDAVHLENFDPNDVYGPHAIENFQFADGTTLTYTQLIDRGFDLEGTEGNDILSGTNVVDRIRGAGGDDVIAGGAGNDELFGGAGNDTYVFGLGDGLDTIHDAAASGAENLIEFGAGVTRNHLVFDHEGNTLTIQYGAAGDAIRLPDFNAHNVNGTVVAATLKFADGGTASLAQLANRAPTLANALAAQDAMEDSPFSLQVPADAFVDVDVGDTLSYNATLADGSALPGWLAFDAATRTFSGTPARADVGAINVKVTATDSSSLSAFDIFGLTIAKIPGQTLVGTASNDTLNGGGGDDTLDGRGGSDRLLGNGGDDTFQYFADAKWTRQFAAHNEGSPGNPGTGRNAAIAGKNRSYDVFQGGPGTDVLLGTGGDDALFLDDRYSPFPSGREARLSGIERIEGGSGNDVIDLTSRDYGYGDVTLDGGEGNDVLWASGGNDVLLGGPGNDELFGGAGNDNLSGGTGTDTMIGGAGNDTYIVDTAKDVVTENAGAGLDTVNSSVTYTLAANVENLTLTGGSSINGTGNKLNNVIIGNSAANTLNGGAGADTLIGGDGNDIYVLDNASDVVTENAGEGFDTINSSVTRTISANVEKLVLTGGSAIHGTGSTDDDYIVGNTAKNTLTGGAGNDLLNGGAGADTLKGDAGNDVLEGMNGNDALTDTGGNNLFNGGAGTDTMTGNTGNELFIGGAGNDTITASTGKDIFAFNRGDGQDTINSSAGADNTLSIGGGIRYADMTFTKKTNNLVLNLGGRSEKVTLTNWYASSPANKSVLNLQVIAEAMADFNASSADPLLNKKVSNFDFLGLASAFDAAGAPANWALTHARLAEHLSGSDTEALGGDLAYRYGLTGSLANAGFDPAVSILSDASFGTAAQAFQSQAALEQGIKRLS